MNAPVENSTTTSTATATTTSTARPSADFQVERSRWAQFGGILRLELRQTLFSRLAFIVYALALFPMPFLVLWNLFSASHEFMKSAAEADEIFVKLYFVYLNTAIFLSALILFMSLFRAEILQRSLHYYFLTPVRREILVLGKYVSAVISSALIFTISTTTFYLLVFLPLGLKSFAQHLFHGPGLGHLLTYLMISTLACAGYGAFFLLAGLVMRNPVVAAVVVFGWELGSPIWPALLKKFSVTFYLQALFPVPPKMGAFSLLPDPISPLSAFLGLIFFIAFMLALTSWRARWTEIAYGSD